MLARRGCRHRGGGWREKIVEGAHGSVIVPMHDGVGPIILGVGVEVLVRSGIISWIDTAEGFLETVH